MKKILSMLLVVSMMALMMATAVFADEQAESAEAVQDVEVVEAAEAAEADEDVEEAEAIEADEVVEDAEAVEADEDVEAAEAVEDDVISVYVNGEKLEFDVPPQLINGRTMVPMRFIFEKLGAVVSYDEETETVTAFYPQDGADAAVIILQIGNPVAFTGNTQIELDAAPVLIDGRTLVPVRFVSESLGYTVDWDEDSKSVIITSKSEESAQAQEVISKEDYTESDSEEALEEIYEEDMLYEDYLNDEIYDDYEDYLNDEIYEDEVPYDDYEDIIEE